MLFQKNQNYIAFNCNNFVVSTTTPSPDNLPVSIEKIREEITQEIPQISQNSISDAKIVHNINGAITEIEQYTNFYILDQVRISKYGNQESAKYGYPYGTRLENIAGNVNNIRAVYYKSYASKELKTLEVDNDYKIEVDDENLKRYNVIMLKHFKCFDSSINSMQIEYRCGFENNDFSQLPNNLQNLIIKITVKRIATLFRICNQLLDADIKTLLSQYTISSKYWSQI